MITFDLDTLRSLAKAATREMDYWRELFDPDSGYFTVRLGVVAVVLSEAIEAGVVQLPDEDLQYSVLGNPKYWPRDGEKDEDAEGEDDPGLAQRHAELSDAVNDGYLIGFERGKAAMRRELLGDKPDDGRLVTVSADDEQPPEHDPDPDGSIAQKEYIEAVDALVGADTYNEFMNGNGAHAEPEPTSEPDPVDDPPPPSVALIYKREPTEAEIAYGQKLAQELSPQAAATLGPEHVVVTPLIPRRQLPDADVCRDNLANALAAGTDEGMELRAEIKELEYKELEYNEHRGVKNPGKRVLALPKGARKSPHGNYLPTVDELIATVQKLAMAGAMPSRATFDLNKPTNWATGQAQLNRLGISWSELAAQAGLTPNPRGTEKAT